LSRAAPAHRRALRDPPPGASFKARPWPLLSSHTLEEIRRMYARVGLAMAAAVLLQAPHRGGVKTREVEYKQGTTVLKGLVAWNDSIKEKRPGVLVVHEWWGLNDHARRSAERLAE